MGKRSSWWRQKPDRDSKTLTRGSHCLLCLQEEELLLVVRVLAVGQGCSGGGQRQPCPVLQWELYQEMFTERKQVQLFLLYQEELNQSCPVLTHLTLNLCGGWVCVYNMTLWSQLSFSDVVGEANTSMKKGLKYIWNLLPWCQWSW